MASIESLEPRLLLSHTVVLVHTSMGSFAMELYPEQAPITVQNFLNYVERQDYNNSFIHRSVPDFVIQGGGFLWPTGEEIPTDPPIPNEYGIANTRGTVAMAKIGGDPHSATSQWFVNHQDNPVLDDVTDPSHLGYTVFGRVIRNGMEVVDSIAALPTWDFGGPFSDLPLRGFDPEGELLERHMVLVHSVEVLPNERDVVIGRGAPRILRFTDATGTEIVARLEGPGNAMLRLGGRGLEQHVSGNTVTIIGDNIELDIISITDTNLNSNFRIRGSGGDGVVSVNAITADSLINVLVGPEVNITGGTVVVPRVVNMRLGNLIDSSIVVEGVGRASAIRLGDVLNTTLVSADNLQRLWAASWNNSGTSPEIMAPRINVLRTDGDANFNLQLGGEGAPPRVLGEARIGGMIGGGHWELAGNSGPIHADMIVPEWTGNVHGRLLRLRTEGNASGNLVAASANVIRVGGNLQNGSLTIWQSFDERPRVLNRLNVLGWISNYEVRTGAGIGQVNAAGIADSTIFAGIAALPPGQPLPTGSEHFISPSRIAGVVIRPEGAFVGSNIAAFRINNAVLRTVQTDNGGQPFGLAAERIVRLRFFLPDGTRVPFDRLRQQEVFDNRIEQLGVDPGDFEVRIIPVV